LSRESLLNLAIYDLQLGGKWYLEIKISPVVFQTRLFKVAESEGFEPPVPLGRTADFESAPFVHSGNSPFSGPKDRKNPFVNKNSFHKR
jgi:hypothetical protein